MIIIWLFVSRSLDKVRLILSQNVFHSVYVVKTALVFLKLSMIILKSANLLELLLSFHKYYYNVPKGRVGLRVDPWSPLPSS